MVTTDVPGLNLDWLNVDTEQGQTAEPGRSGLTLQQINSTMYGADNLDEVRNRSLTVRGSAPDLRSSPHARQYHYKGDVWSDSAMLLYEEANQRQWASATDIPWEKVEPLSDDLEMAMCTLCTFLTQVEFIAGDVPGRFLEQVPTDFFESQLFLGTQVMDEARHQDVFRKRIFVNGGGMSDAGFAWSPDGTRIAFVSYRDGDWEIYTMRSDGTDVLQLTVNAASDVGPAWSPDGTRIAFVSARVGGDGAEIYSMRSDGTDVRRLTENSWTDLRPAWSP